MACGPCAKRKAQQNMQFQVVTASGRTVYRSDNRASAEKVAARYPGSEVKEPSA